MTPQNTIEVGFGQVDITPRKPIQSYRNQWLGSAPPDEPELETLCALIRDREQTIALVALDVLWISRDVVLRIREEAHLMMGGRLSGLIIAATHTHCAPSLAPMFLESPLPDPLYTDLVVKRVLCSLKEAEEKLCQAQICPAIAQAPGFEFSRRYRREDGRVVTTLASDSVEGLEPCGPVDRDVPLWLFKTVRGDPIGVIFSYASHNNAARAPFLCPDIAGYCRCALAEHFGEKFVGLMVPGACGDVVWTDPVTRPKGGTKLAAAIGTKLAESLTATIAKSDAVPVPRLKYGFKTFRVADRPAAESSYCEDGCRGSSAEERARQHRRYDPEREAVESRGESSAVVEISALGLGNTALVTNPAELFTRLGLSIRSRSPFPVTLIAELTNGHVGYVPAEEDFDAGGYETHRTVYTSRLSKEAGNRIVDVSLDLLNEFNDHENGP